MVKTNCHRPVNLMNIIYNTDAAKTKNVMYWTYLQYARENDKRF